MTIGTAYGFVHYEGRKDILKNQIPSLKIASNSPIDLEILLIELEKIKIEEDINLEEVLEKARSSDFNFVLKANYQNTSNEETASELSKILMQANQSFLNQENEFWGVVVYKTQQGNYIRF